MARWKGHRDKELERLIKEEGAAQDRRAWVGLVLILAAWLWLLLKDLPIDLR